MNRIENFTIVNEAYTSTKKSRTFLSGGFNQDQQRHARDLKIAAVVSSKITGFFDNNTKFRSTAIGMYFRNLDNGKKKVEASEIVAVSLGWTKNYKSKCISAWAKQWIRNKTVPTSKRGKHSKMQSLWSHEDIADQVGSYVRSKKFDITPKNLSIRSQPNMRDTVFDGSEQKMVDPDGK
ncbi:8792_t:CDS:2 [Entrophospora sp. SA101]|nr:8792_t:CDS:2 [Entrophospora sp. SA101]